MENEVQTPEYMYWDPVEEACYAAFQLELHKDDIFTSEVRSRLKPILKDDWLALIELNATQGKIIKNNPTTDLPMTTDPEPLSEKEELEMEKQQIQSELEATNTETILYLQQLMTPVMIPGDETSEPIMTPEEYAALNASRLQKANRLKEIETELAALA